MTRRGVPWLFAAAVVAALAAWFGAAELVDSARLVVVLLVAVLPALLLVQGGISAEQLRGARVEPVYISSMALIWAVGALALWAGRASGMSLAEMGLMIPDPGSALAWTGGIMLAAIGITLLGRRLGWRESPMLEWLLPESTGERALFVLLSISAGVGEEMAYRGFLIPALEDASGSRALAVIVSSIAFGMMHSYQQASGALRASLLGGLLAVPLLLTGSIIPSMAAHALFDVIAGLVLADWLLPDRTSRTHDDDAEH